MRAKQPRVQPNAADPFGNETRILARCYGTVVTTTAGKQEFARRFVGRLQIVIDRLRVCSLNSNLTGRPVFFCRTVARSAVYPPAATSSTRIATTSQPRSLLSIARLNMARSRARPSIWSFVRIDQTCLGRSGGFAPVSFPLFQGTRLGLEVAFARSCMAILLGLVTEGEKNVPPERELELSR